MGQRSTGLAEGFLKSVEAQADRPALVVEDGSLSYGDLWRKAGATARAVRSATSIGPPLAAVFASRSQSSYVGVLGVLGAGCGYVPLNVKFPGDRNRAMLTLSGCRTVVAGPESLSALKDVLAGLDREVTVILPRSPEPGVLDVIKDQCPGHRWIVPDDESHSWPSPTVAPTDTAYLMFTSGSTGRPKGVPVSQGNAAAYVAYVSRRYGVTAEDRLSQTFDLTFDLSVHDMFVAWSNGACLCVVPETSVMAPGKFIKDQALTMWFSVPSTAMFMARLRMLKPGSFPTLRWSLFCGEPLSAESAGLWQAAAPHSRVENLYGPTEATIAITHYRWDPETSPGSCRNGMVPIGHAFDGQTACVCGGDGRPTEPDQPGELCLAGSQVTAGYLDEPEKTAEKFQTIPACGPGTWYRTGDLVARDEAGCIHFIGRLDHQVQILGHRVEMQEVEFRLKEALGAETVVCVPWPSGRGPVTGLYAFASGNTTVSEADALDYCRKNLPEYMIPKKIFPVGGMPLNVNGKVDRNQLASQLKELLG